MVHKTAVEWIKEQKGTETLKNHNYTTKTFTWSVDSTHTNTKLLLWNNIYDMNTNTKTITVPKMTLIVTPSLI